ncbi:MAG: hypothetical protein JNL26_14070, partial [Gemmatimonadetes bacterium]|nr:hypothetical protein [Gemmatimonadota bacterium]
MRYPVIFLALTPLALGAQAVQLPTSNTAVTTALESIKRDNAWTLQQQVSICEIPAPPFKEQVRGQEVVRRFKEHGLQNVRVDAEGNVIGERPGTGNGPTVVLSG